MSRVLAARGGVLRHRNFRLLVTGSSIALLTVAGTVNGVLGALSGPSSSALTPQTVPEDELARAVAVRRLLQNGAMVLGFAVAGILVGVFGSGWAIAIDAATFVVAATSFHLIDVPAVAGTGQRERMLAEMKEGVVGPIVVKDAVSEAAWGWALGAVMGGSSLLALTSNDVRRLERR